ncbi:hypothetical protein MLD38_038081 [Melastoma candidum]|uniref:Uncharacterized protein n=1 Tax=Melastoma candidum TaxID=119954 RepID=A0ACB9KXW3_9MYRT|nr:hypothetical protein MLD38_038081 [Melastoma candidum]
MCRLPMPKRRIDLTSHIVKVYLTLKLEGIGTSSVSEVLLAFPPTQANHLALIKAQAAVGKRNKKTYVPLDVKPKELPDGPNGTKYFSIYLLDLLNPGETSTLEILYMLTHSLEPFPLEISQSESQLVYFRDSAFILSLYHIDANARHKGGFCRVEYQGRLGYSGVPSIKNLLS